MSVRLRSTLVLFTLIGSACSAPSPAPVDGPEPAESLAEPIVFSGTVQDAMQNTCTTTSVWGLAQQIVDQIDCDAPGSFSGAVPSEPNLVLGSATFAFMEVPARDALVAALKADPQTTMTINSMLRTVAQQYLLYQWYQGGRCGIGLAAVPGNSNHESGLAVDVSEYNSWMSAMQSSGFKWYGSADPVHFDYVGAGAVDLRGKDVLAFQELWNENNPNDTIATDGSYGPQTEGKLQGSPAGGFPKGATCGQQPPPPQPKQLDAAMVTQGSDAKLDPSGKSGPQVCAGAPVKMWIELRDTGAATWVDDGDTAPDHWGHAVRLGVPGDAPDAIVGKSRVSVNDSSNAQVVPSGGDCATKGCARTRFDLAGAAPAATGTIESKWQLVDEARAWFGPTATFTFDVVACDASGGSGGPTHPPGGSGSSGDGTDGSGGANGASQDGGCSTGGGGAGSGWAWIATLAAAFVPRRRTASFDRALRGLAALVE